MKMTWSEMREEIYSLVFADEKDRKLYEPAMINGVNYAVRDLLLRVCPDIRSVEVCVAEPENLIGAGGGSALYVLRRGKTAVFSVENCECVSFCYKGEGELHIESGGTLTVYPQEYSENFKEFTLTTDKTERIRITLLSDTQMIVKDLGLYEYGTGFSPWKKYVGFDMYELTQGHFAGLYEKRAVVSVKDDGLYDGYYFEMPCRIYFARENTGMFRIYY